MKYSAWPVVEVCVGGERLRFEQDNGSMHVGTSVWPCSLLLAKCVERHTIRPFSDSSPSLHHHTPACRPQALLPFQIKGKRGVELDSGCGVAGLALALLGMNVLLTDIPVVLPALKRNVKKNMLATSLGMAGKRECKAGKVKIVQLCWGNAKQIEAAKPPFDFIIAADVVYLDNAVEPLLQTIHALAGPDSIILLGYQMRSTEAHELFWRVCPERFVVHKVPRDQLNPEYAFEETDVYILQKKEES